MRMVSENMDGTEEELEEVLLFPETLCVDTEYVLEETDILNHTVVETTWRLPDKYVGLNREIRSGGKASEIGVYLKA